MIRELISGYAAITHDQTAVGHGSELLVVGHNDEGLAELASQAEEQFVKLAGIRGVEVTRGLIGEDDIWLVDECPRHRHALLLASGKLCGLVSGPVSHSQKVQQIEGSFFCLAPHRASDEGRNAYILQSGKFGKQIMKLKNETDMPVAERRQFRTAQSKYILLMDAE